MMAQFILRKGYLGPSYGGGCCSVPENMLLLINLAVKWNDFDMWAAVSGLVSGALSIAIYSPISRILRPALVDKPRFVSLTSPSTVLVQSTRPRQTWPDLQEALRRTNSCTT